MGEILMLAVVMAKWGKGEMSVCGFVVRSRIH
jgi:hypothetical protein